MTVSTIRSPRSSVPRSPSPLVPLSPRPLVPWSPRPLVPPSPGPLCLLSALCLLLIVTGCSRTSYRLRADDDALCLIEQQASDPRWSLDNYHIYPNPRSRMASPFNPDFPPMPPDDSAANRLMQCVDGKRGYRGWYRWGTTPFVANPDWKSFVPLDPQGRLQLDRNSSVQAALLNSPQFQTQLENLYLSALDVSFEQFRFDAQFFGGYQAFFKTSGRQHPDGRSSELALSTRSPNSDSLQMSKMFAGGGQLVVGFANSLIWEFSGPNRQTASTILDFSLIQPLLRGGGRARVLERLTVAERALLANVRQMERFRQGFYTEIVAGLDPGAGPTRRGGLAGGAGLEGFTGVGTGGFGRLGGVGITGGGRPGTGAGQAGGFVGLLQTRQQLQNQRINIIALRNSLASLQAKFQAGGRIDFFQVELARQALYNAQSRLLTSQANYQSQLDQFKIDLGLPPDMPLAIDDPLLSRFDLLDPHLIQTQEFAENLLNDIRDPNVQFDASRFREVMARTGQLMERIDQQLAAVGWDLQTLQHNIPQRRRILR
ncbi:MAG: TolC family protein, partial [Planctomycetota bacterium]|nr:TolC family protein [Planctomycetota bacterium]